MTKSDQFQHDLPGASDTPQGNEHLQASVHLDTAPSDTWVVTEAQKIPPRLPLSFEESLAAVTMVIVALITLANVIARYFLKISFAFTEEYSSVLLFVMVFITASAATAKNTHIKMTFFTERLSPRNQKYAEVLGAVAVMICFAVVIYYGSIMTWDAYRFGETSPGIGHPQWIYLIWLPLLSLLALCRAFGAAARVLAVRVE